MPAVPKNLMPPIDLTSGYGAEECGLVCGYLFTPDTQAQPIDSTQAVQWLAALHATESAAQDKGPASFVWLHFNLAHASAERWLARHAGLSDTFFETLKDGLHSTRIERADQSLIAVINDVHFDFAFEPSDISTLWISVDQTEDELLAAKLDHQRARLGELRRLLVRLQRLLAPEPAALFRLLQHPPTWMAPDDVEELRQSTEEFSVVLHDMSSLQERIKLLQEEIAASVNEDNGRSLFVLTVVTVLALPINILAGLFGMNVGGIPLADNPHGFWIVVAIVVTFTAVAGWLAWRKK